jgi:hypothetical protein
VVITNSLSESRDDQKLFDKRPHGVIFCLESHRPFISYRTYRRLPVDPNMTYDAEKPIAAAGLKNYHADQMPQKSVFFPLFEAKFESKIRKFSAPARSLTVLRNA